MQPRSLGQLCRVLDIDPDLGRAIDASDWAEARQAVRGEVFSVGEGPLVLPAPGDDNPQSLGFLLVDGLLCRELKLRDRHLIELLGPGDLLQHPREDDRPRLGAGPRLTVVGRSMLLALGSSFVIAGARWPGLMIELLERVERQRHLLAVQELIVHLPRASHRLLLMLSHLSSRWGRMTLDGIHLPLRLTHDLLGQLVAARRPTVTLAMQELERQGSIVRMADGTLLLTPLGQESADVVARTDTSRSMGDLLLRRQRSGGLSSDARTLPAHARQLTKRH
jgi:CRP/FNR family transcriptional regulator, cyclic AMP receptor protein